MRIYIDAPIMSPTRYVAVADILLQRHFELGIGETPLRSVEYVKELASKKICPGILVSNLMAASGVARTDVQWLIPRIEITCIEQSCAEYEVDHGKCPFLGACIKVPHRETCPLVAFSSERKAA